LPPRPARRRPAGDLAVGAREAAAQSSGAGRTAWLCAASALNAASTPDEAREVLTEMVTDDRLRILAQSCLAALRGGDDTTTETT
jgi:hypothetical protein